MFPLLPDPDNRFEMWMALQFLTKANNPLALAFLIGTLIFYIVGKLAALTIDRPARIQQTPALKRSSPHQRGLRGAVICLGILCVVGAFLAGSAPTLGIGLIIISLSVLVYIIAAELIVQRAQRSEQPQPAPPPLPEDVSIADVISWKQVVDESAARQLAATLEHAA